MSGPLPDPGARRRNSPTIPATSLPVEGRSGPIPRVPASYSLEKAGKAWWQWAWKLPHAAGWSDGDLYTVVRRAALEDDLAALGWVEGFDLAELLGIEDAGERGRALEHVVSRLKALAGGRLAIMKEMRELEMKLGLNPKALADLRWKIVQKDPASTSTTRTSTPPSKRRLRAVDPIAAGA